MTNDFAKLRAEHTQTTNDFAKLRAELELNTGETKLLKDRIKTLGVSINQAR